MSALQLSKPRRKDTAANREVIESESALNLNLLFQILALIACALANALHTTPTSRMAYRNESKSVFHRGHCALAACWWLRTP